jgi:hypothetical protein
VIREDSPERLWLLQKNRALLVGAVVYVLALVALLLCVDVFTIQCDRGRDRCEYESVALVRETHAGQFAPSRVNYLVDTVALIRSGRSRVTSRAQLRAVMSDGSTVLLEPESRMALISDGVTEGFIAFRRDGEASFSRVAVHVGHLGFFLVFTITIASVLAMFGLSRELVLDFSAGTFRARCSGVRAGRSAMQGALSDIAALEVVTAGPQLGAYLRARSGARVKIAMEPNDPVVSTIARRGLPVEPCTSEAIVQGGAAQSLVPAMLVLLAGFAPLLVMAVWPFIERLL